MHEAIARGDDQSLIPPALKMIDYSMARGWDEEYGGLLYFVDADGKPPTRLEWDMKLWWPHAEALYALLLAFHLSGDRSVRALVRADARVDISLIFLIRSIRRLVRLPAP